MARGKKRNPKCMRGRCRGYVLEALSSGKTLLFRCYPEKSRQFIVIDDPVRDISRSPEYQAKMRELYKAMVTQYPAMRLWCDDRCIWIEDPFKDIEIKGELKLEKPPEFISVSHAL